MFVTSVLPSSGQHVDISQDNCFDTFLKSTVNVAQLLSVMIQDDWTHHFSMWQA